MFATISHGTLRINVYDAKREYRAPIPCANIEGPDQPAHRHSPIRVFSVRQYILQYLLIQ